MFEINSRDASQPFRDRPYPLNGFRFVPSLKTVSALVVAISIAVVTAGESFAGTIQGEVIAYGVKDPRNTVVYIDKIEGQTFDPPAEPAVLNQLNKEFVPHVLPILKGSKVTFLNNDPFLHNVRIYSRRKTLFNLGMPIQGQKITKAFDQTGEIVVLCDVHPEMSAYIIAIETPYAAVVAENGRFEITDVPPGDYTLKAWHEKLKPASIAITVPENGSANVKLELR